ncbi:MAG: helix-turn-helix domain-containing protein, partial [Desulfovibrio sp.]|nr:helix-turn-helix domain-containing protein [Desulfovibrio sp.]
RFELKCRKVASWQKKSPALERQGFCRICVRNNLRAGKSVLQTARPVQSGERINMADTDTDLISTSGIADLLGISTSTVRKWADTMPGFPSPRVGLTKRTRRWAKADILDWQRRRLEMLQPPAETPSASSHE